MQMDTIAQKIAVYEELREQADAAKEELAELNRQKDAAEAEVISAMLDMEEETGTSVRIGYEGRNYSVSARNFYSIPKASRDLAFDQLRNLGMGDLIQEKVDDRTLTKELDTVFEENGCAFPEEYSPLFALLNQYSKSTLRRVKA